MDLNLIGQRALVSGGTQGIGRAVAEELARNGASITLLGRDRGKAEAAIATLDQTHGQQHSVIVADMSDTSALQHALEGLKGIDILVNNTGGPPPGLAHEAEVAAFESAFRLHLLAFQTLVRATVPGMKERKHGRIVNIISTSVKVPLANLGVSNTIRGAVAQWAKTLANELGAFNITVNNVLPGATETGRLLDIIRRNAQRKGIPEAEAAEEMMREVPLRRFARPEEVANAVAFLCSPAAGYINGINLPVDGGRTGSL